MKLGKQVGLGPGHIVLDGDPKKGAEPPQLFAHVSCMANRHGPTTREAAWIKMPLGMEVGIGPSDFVSDVYPAPLSKKGAPPPSFRPRLLC